MLSVQNKLPKERTEQSTMGGLVVQGSAVFVSTCVLGALQTFQ